MKKLQNYGEVYIPQLENQSFYEQIVHVTADAVMFYRRGKRGSI